MNKRLKSIIKIATGMKSNYSVVKFTFDDDHDHPVGLCEMTNGSIVRVYGVSNTSGTEDKHVAQNILKRAREAFKRGLDSCAYGGGKA
jgi:hypothetical protein